VSVNPAEEVVQSQFTPESIIRDYRIAFQSRQASLIGRKEVLTGKAKFGIFGDGKEVAQLAMARAFRKGDFRSGYYRDQTFMFATGLATLDEFFGQLYANTDPAHDPFSAGRSMNCHFGSRTVDENGDWLDLTDRFNTASDISPTGGQMPRLVGLAYASRLYREVEELKQFTQFSRNGDEIAFGTIGNASCAEGMFWEAINAAGVLQAPLLMSVWDDGYGISVPNEFQVTKSSISEVLKGFRRDPDTRVGYDIYVVRGWDYPALCETYLNAAAIVRMEHVPALVHVIEVTQPQGHSTSGSHERYKTSERLEWEDAYCCIRKMRQWMVDQGIATDEQLTAFEKEDLGLVRDAQRRAWAAYRAPIDAEREELVSLLEAAAQGSAARGEILGLAQEIRRSQAPFRRDLMRAAMTAIVFTRDEPSDAVRNLVEWREKNNRETQELYSSDLYSPGEKSALEVEEVPAEFSEGSPSLRGFEVLNACFDEALKRHPNLIAFGEDVGRLGDVNQGFAGLQDKFGALRVADTGIRECTILGQAIGMAMRGLRPIAEIQYLDYILYALQIMSDDLATLRWRTKGAQKAPVIVRTRGHRLEGIWHSGSPMAGIISLVRGMWVCVPRDMTQAAGMYNTLLQSDDPAIVVEVLNGYRAKERKPDNIADFTVPLGVPEILREGSDVTIVTYGASCRIAMDAADLLNEVDISAEIIDVQTLLPFDLEGVVLESLKKTSRVVFLDEDVPGGASAYMLQQVLETQGGYEWLDAEPRTVAAKEHRPAYGSDGDYWSKPNREEIFEVIYAMMNESDPRKFPKFF
jgi:2-oxoisovalerate dehydrogenase E1 component